MQKVFDSLFDRNLRDKEDKREIVFMTVVITLLVILLFLKMFVFETVEVVGPSMKSTLNSGDILLINKLDKYTYEDIIVFEKEDKSERVIKRVIGLPGDEIEIKNGLVYRKSKGQTDFKLLNEYYLGGKKTEIKTNVNQWVIGKGELFVLGDNRPDSYDCRYYGPIKDSQVIGVVVDFTVKIKDTVWSNVCYVI